ncbi:MAG: Trm112 family protein [candidate division KSB1 bacterium]|nr:Trm112 family protein [candidate division KSB1 bacterium]MDZ7273217.1 Trm112 family protein [candidate division KSB1 bacterium]MDZ7285319.1 Trm112 family protein [candidate division KSB1 bacterium]MDZ7298351.1 Trm112 family protein [candidate division KSB1 bacterium]MDZ7308515.1 Trm112 family protein [candidate division KSB1 bacterium]
MDQELINILCCPQSKVPVELLSSEELARLNRAIAAGKIKQVDGTPVKKPISEALITRDRKTIYRVDDGIPVMLIEQGIPAAQLEGAGKTT